MLDQWDWRSLLRIFNWGKRKEFEAKLQQAFEEYFKDPMAHWTGHYEAQLKEAFLKLGQIADEYGKDLQTIITLLDN